jgi:apolipoprotein N-acyltransferase
MERLTSWLLLLAGWRRLAVAAAAGAFGALAMAPFHFWPVFAISFPLAIQLLDATPSRKRFDWPALRSALVLGWSFGFGYFLAGLWWLGAAFLVETDEFIWLLPFGVVGLPAVLALFHALGFMLARLLWSPGIRRIFAFAAGMAIAEWLRAVSFTGFPWNSIGQVFSATDATLQTASLVGLHGLTVTALILFATPVQLATETHFRQRYVPLAVSVVVLGAMLAFGMNRLQTTRLEVLQDVRMRIMQPNIGQREKHAMSGQAVLSRYLQLSDRSTGPTTGSLKDVTHLIWPESPFPFLLAREPEALRQIGAAIAPRTTLITGAIRSEDSAGERRFYNAIQVVGPDGVVVDSYDKTHLVPFGEYLPFRQIFDALRIRQFVQVPGGFEAGRRRKPLTIPGLPKALPLICYEAIFPDEVAGMSAPVGLIITVSNDAWFGNTPGPAQHLDQARMRSVELGLTQFRSANTGLSAAIDPLGRIVHSLALGQEGVIDSFAWKPVADPLFTRTGNIFAIFMILFSIFVCTRAKLKS